MSYQQQRPNGFRSLPTVVKNLLIINVLMFFLTLFYQYNLHIDLADYLGLHNFSSPAFRPYQFVTYMFMHATTENGSIYLFHILFNMFALWMFGNVLENFWGPKRFLIFYMITGIGAALIYMCYQSFHLHQIRTAIEYLAANPSPENYIAVFKNHFGAFYENPDVQLQVDQFVRNWSMHVTDQASISSAIEDLNQLYGMQVNSPMIGASGAIFGILMAFGMLFPNTELYLMFIPIPIKAKFAVILYGVIELVSGVVQFSGDNVAHFAHLGGMLFGFILIKYWQKKSNRFY